MSQLEPPVVEERHNFRAVNDYISHILDRQHDLLAYRRFKRWRVLMVGIAAVIIALGIAYLLYSWGEYIQKKEPPAEVIMRDVYVPELSEAEKQGGNVTVKYTVFHTVKISNSKEVVTGYNYAPEQTDYPYYQYCYVSVVSSNIKSLKYDVAEKNGVSRVNWHHEIPADLFQLGQNNCRFKN